MLQLCSNYKGILYVCFTLSPMQGVLLVAFRRARQLKYGQY